jgi:hypothetical protein
MPKFMAMILLLLAAGCSTALTTSGDAICDGTRAARAELTRALLADGGDQSVMAGQVLISQLDAACR